MRNLYSFTDESGTEQFASLIGKNENGNYVLEVKGTKNIVVRKPTEVTEVLPHTVDITMTNYNGSRSTMSYEVPKDKLKVGDIVVDPTGPSVGVVKQVDTKSTTAKSVRGLRVIPSETL